MYAPLLHTHWLFAVLVLLLTAFSLIRTAAASASKSAFGNLDNKLSLFVLIAAHIQLLVGVALYFTSPVHGAAAFSTGEVMSNPEYRFYAVEHLSVNIIAIVLLTIGRSGLKRKTTDAAKFKHLLIFFGLGFLLLLSRVPWDRLFTPPGA